MALTYFFITYKMVKGITKAIKIAAAITKAIETSGKNENVRKIKYSLTSCFFFCFFYLLIDKPNFFSLSLRASI